MDKTTLHQLVDALPDSEVYAAGKYLEFLRVNSESVTLAEEELAAVDQAIASLERGESLSHQEVGERLSRWIPR